MAPKKPSLRQTRGDSGNKEERTLSAGELVLLPRGSGHLLYDGPGRSFEPIEEVVGRSPQGSGCAVVNHGGGGERTWMKCGSFEFRAGREGLLLPLLPRVMVLFGSGEDQRSQLEFILRLMVTEARRQEPGAGLVLSRMAEVLFVQVLRSWLETRGDAADASWLNAMRDGRIAAALRAMHARPDHPWSLAELASAANMSRSPFAALFKRMVGEAPLTYPKHWRLNLATDLLEETDLGLKERGGRARRLCF